MVFLIAMITANSLHGCDLLSGNLNFKGSLVANVKFCFRLGNFCTGWVLESERIQIRNLTESLHMVSVYSNRNFSAITLLDPSPRFLFTQIAIFSAITLLDPSPRFLFTQIAIFSAITLLDPSPRFLFTQIAISLP